MKKQNSPYHLWKILLWSFIALLLLVLTLLPVGQSMLPWDDGFAFAQTGPPPRDDDDDDDDAGFPPGPPPTIPPGGPPTSCPPQLPPGLQIVDHIFLETPPEGIPPVAPQRGDFIARIPAAQPPVTPLASLPVPSGVITEPVAILPFPLLPRFYCSLIVPTEVDRDLIVRLENLPLDQPPIPLTQPDVVPADWYLDPHPLVTDYLGHGAPIPIVAPGVIPTNYVRYAQLMGLPTSPIPPQDAAAAGVLPTMLWQGQAISVESVFKLDVYDAETLERITIHVPELVLITCGDFDPHLVLLRANEAANRYDIPVQNLDRQPTGDFRDRLRAFLLETSSTFIIARVSGQAPPPLASDQQSQTAGGGTLIPSGLPRTGAEIGSRPISWILMGAGVLAVVVGLGLYRKRSR